ncbi:MAG: hypothetical protein IT282_15435 [Bacteroidetes bacterium]|nr:hypothetical protein [Bacteroidota bacterium]
MVLDHNLAKGLAQALRLSSVGLVVETVPDVQEAAGRLSAMAFDAVFYTCEGMDIDQRRKVQVFPELYPDTLFLPSERIGLFLEQIRKGTPKKETLRRHASSSR